MLPVADFHLNQVIIFQNTFKTLTNQKYLLKLS
ncbi:hypothetical protein Cyan10605_1100 [Cyanobacterium aponinum PCC 10605]|uniref:Uncharacterized protein n=1 Tax=Cyanobacterium aponinum (strain PCC 10605) TaxID=755178 RepID=K9Z3C6_CYAAP|nr:hypothetical protein Cyan10605_1100 [Cyanobacterium aponinum PCC 10605]